MLSQEAYCAALERDAASFAELIRSGDLTIEVDGCPGWTMLDLAKHLGGVHRWAYGIVATGAPADQPDGPDTRDALLEWFTDGAAQLLDLLQNTDPDAPTWAFGSDPHRVSFWLRRQAHETAMHLYDARRALHGSGTPDDDLAPDAIDEVVSMFFPRQVRLGRIPPLTHGVRITISDGPQTSYVLAGDGTDPRASTVATVTGPAARLLLAMWGRSGVDGLEIVGDPAVVRATFAAGITP
jgi:uncharacterized protein (TIGR03083 family)